MTADQRPAATEPAIEAKETGRGSLHNSAATGVCADCKAAGFSRRELARQLHTDVRILKRWKNGTRPDSANLLALFVLAAGMGLLHLLLPEAGGSVEGEEADVGQG